ncbi:MAG: 5'/3'-nucleotidase SurE [Actinobacteria bacterium]|nr:5'/3'-nucleotidase SurE [Actinomycetota bacterium]
MGPILLTNDDGVMATGLRTLHRAMLRRGLDVLVVAPSENRSGVSRNATYGTPVTLTPVDGDERVLACSGTPVDCVRAAVLGDLAPDASLVVSGINHGPNLGDDTLNSGTVGAAIEGSLLGVPAFAVSQQDHVGHFHILDSFDQTTPIYDDTAAIAALLVERALAWTDWPDRLVLNLNVPAEVDVQRTRPEVTRLGRRFYAPGSVPRETDSSGYAYRTYGKRTDPPPPFESAAGTDFGAVAAGDLALTPLSYDWQQGGDGDFRSWTAERCRDFDRALREEYGEADPA